MNDFTSGYSACPRCGQIDMVQRVSSIVASQSQTGSSFGFGSVGQQQMQFRSTSQRQTVLSQRLSPPKEPSHWQLGVWGWVLLLVAFLLFCSVFSANSGGIIIGVYIGLCIGLIVLVAFWYKKEAPKRQAQYQADLFSYRRAMEKWNNLYYCARDDGVFIPGPGAQFIPIGSMRNYLSS